jgi:hypothetical protein
MHDSGGVRDYLFRPTLVDHIHLDKHLITNSFIKVIIYEGLFFSSF